MTRFFIAALLLLLSLGSVDAARSLMPRYATPLKLGSVSPRGWLATQLMLERDGVVGNLSRIYADVANSTWLGGDATEDGGLHERLPYWLNAAVPLAYLLENDSSGAPSTAPQCPASLSPLSSSPSFPFSSSSDGPRRASGPPSLCAVTSNATSFSLRDEVTRVVHFILESQAPSGWLGGPGNDTPDEADQYWPAWDVLYALMFYAEAEPATASRIQDALLIYVAEARRRLDRTGLTGWSSVRWPEWVAILQQMDDTFDLPPDAPEHEMLLEMADAVTAAGFDWISYFTSTASEPNFNDSSLPFAPGWSMTEHGVNHAMAMKEGAVRWRAGGGGEAHSLSRLKVSMLDAAHGMPTGAFSADECLAGREPSRGVELCTIVEAAHSLGLLHRTHGDVEFADRAERIILNALPGAHSEDLWAHNYLSQTNEIFAGAEGAGVMAGPSPAASAACPEPAD